MQEDAAEAAAHHGRGGCKVQSAIPTEVFLAQIDDGKQPLGGGISHEVWVLRVEACCCDHMHRLQGNTRS